MSDIYISQDGEAAVDLQKYSEAYEKRIAALKAENAELKEERDRLLDNRDAVAKYSVMLQQHRDEWRMYAYGKSDRPTDFLDGGDSLEGPTVIEKLLAENAALKAERDESRKLASEWSNECGARVQSLEAENVELKVYAERYLWLRNEAAENMSDTQILVWSDRSKEWIDIDQPETLDKVIDAAMR